MALTVRNKEVERLAEEVARLAGESKTEAIRKALEIRLKLLLKGKRGFDRVLRFLEEEVWTQIPPELLGKGISKEEEEAILGYGREGY
jgi:antitoxin VapB